MPPKKLNKIKTKAATAAEKTGRQLWSVGHSACFLSNFEPKKLNRVKQKKRHTHTTQHTAQTEKLYY